MKIRRILLSIVLSMTVLPVTAQDIRVLREGEITEAALIEALAPEGGLRTRSIKVFGQPDSVPEQPARASMLITFKTNSAELTLTARQALDTVGRALNMDKLIDFRFIVEGHADLSGSYALNQSLSQARAETVLNYLVQAHGVERRRLEAVGKGYNELLNRENPTAPENRRVTLVRVER
jgi:OOP family OmpA-OmpF porin